MSGGPSDQNSERIGSDYGATLRFLRQIAIYRRIPTKHNIPWGINHSISRKVFLKLKQLRIHDQVNNCIRMSLDSDTPVPSDRQIR
ncbi:hypothetical protein SAMN04488063_1660 [Halopelagius inordinatus]|uniref:Uncharacterized protein n=1 Tax=Halopelagius inordinatus TaxID=553467 RepID=A0A1I2PMK4_9EURY|nr:hypothetical protein SAMN04488063_1660 [Halopelagius inordinatus]